MWISYRVFIRQWKENRVASGAPILARKSGQYKPLCTNMETLRGLACSVDKAYKKFGQKVLIECQLEIREGEDIIRWGRTGDGNFRVKEAYISMVGLGEHQSRPLWGKIWNATLWPKISTFLWLVAIKKILT
jgi:hypothetical protein